MKEGGMVVIYTDGGCLGNPGPGGYGAVLLYNGHRKEISGGFRLTTNNRMEIMGAIAALEALKDRRNVTLFTDSQYLVKSIMEGWAVRWKRNGWMKNRKEAALNTDLWERLLELCKRHDVTFCWVRGHSGDVENERCDVLAKEAASKPGLLIDTGYDKVPGGRNAANG